MFGLPTEGQWEYACRAGTSTAHSFGDSSSSLGDYAWYGDKAGDIGGKYAHGVGLKKPSPWGLYDMHGNVWEWCLDGVRSYSSSSQTDPRSPEGGSRMLRGGSWSAGSAEARSAFRYGVGPTYACSVGGFRVFVVCGRPSD